MKIRWTEGARTDLLEAVAYVSEDNPVAARELAGRLRGAVRHLARFPHSGRVVPEFDDPALRETIAAPYRVIYLLRDEVVILAVHHSRRLLKSMSVE